MGNDKDRVHTITIYCVDGMPRPSTDVLYVKQKEKVKWESAVPGMDFEITFATDYALGFKLDRTHIKENKPFTDEHMARGKYGRYKYSIRELPDGPVLDPSIDIGKP